MFAVNRALRQQGFTGEDLRKERQKCCDEINATSDAEILSVIKGEPDWVL
jgi:hypothetical protein